LKQISADKERLAVEASSTQDSFKRLRFDLDATSATCQTLMGMLTAADTRLQRCLYSRPLFHPLLSLIP
jgi:hypothetical protein